MVKLMVMSATYRQDSRLRPELREIDPSNRLLASQSPAAARGRVRPRQRAGDRRPAQPATSAARASTRTSRPATTRTSSSPTATTSPTRDDRQYRRGVYMHWQRTFLHPMLANFDAPSREDCIGQPDRRQHAAAGADAAERPDLRRGRPRPGRDAAGPAGRDDAARIDRLYRAGAGAAAQADGAAVAARRSSTRAAADVPGDDRRRRAEARSHVGHRPRPGRRRRAAELAAWTRSAGSS